MIEKTNFQILIKTLVCVSSLLLFGTETAANSSPDGIWQQNKSKQQPNALSGSKVASIPLRTFKANNEKLDTLLKTTPHESLRNGRNGNILYLPMPEGDFATFEIFGTSVMEPKLAAKFPQIKTYCGSGLDDPAATVRISRTLSGFHAQILSPNGTVYIDPVQQTDKENVVCYYKRDIFKNADNFHCLLKSTGAARSKPVANPSTGARSGAELRTYRLACAATGEYTAFHGGTVNDGLAAIVTAINRVNGIYEVELSIRMVLVAGNDQLVYTNSATDPYTNDNAFLLLDENQTNIDAIIGTANYDIGHVFSTLDGGLAALGVVGNNDFKAQGYTGLSNPTGDTFYVDYVAHEIGHQFSGNHTFNGDSGSCSGFNRNGSTAYEPGSGSTIQAYAGICGNDDVQTSSDPYFHSINFDEIISYVDSTIPSVGTRTLTGNAIPTVSAGNDYTIPANTPFVLTASGSDADIGNILTYNWEQRDLGPQQDIAAGDNGLGPLFRSFTATTNPSRTFPRLSDLVNNIFDVREKLPATNRTMNFRVTVRDNFAGGGGVNTDDMIINVVDTGAAFAVTSPNNPVSWTALSQQKVMWDVAGTTSNGINTSKVSIHLSTDGGLTYPHTLLASTSNDGSATVTLPNLQTTQARIRIQGEDNIFFDISDNNFIVSESVPGFQIQNSPDVLTVCAPNNAVYTIDVLQVDGFTSPVSLSINGLPSGAEANFSSNPVIPGNSTIVTISSTELATRGIFELEITGTSGASSTSKDLTLNLGPLEAQLIEPVNLALGVEVLPDFIWDFSPGASSYQFDLATDSNFDSIIYTTNVDGIFLSLDTRLDLNTNYFWRVLSTNTCGNNIMSEIFSFTTANETATDSLCSSPSLSIPDGAAPTGIKDSVDINSPGVLTDLNVSVDIQHTWVGDLTVTLSNEDTGTSVELVSRPGLPAFDSEFGFDGGGMTITLDDEGSQTVEDNAPPYNSYDSYIPNNPLSTFDGQNLAGSWTLTITDSADGDEGILNSWCLIPTVVVPTKLEQLGLWLEGFGLGNNDLNTDEDFDGLIALEEYAFNLDPTVNDFAIYDPAATLGTDGPIGLPQIDLAGNPPNQHLQIKFPRRKLASESGIDYGGYFSSDLISWDEQEVLNNVESINDMWEEIIITDPFTTQTAPNGKRFSRVGLTIDP